MNYSMGAPSILSLLSEDMYYSSIVELLTAKFLFGINTQQEIFELNPQGKVMDSTLHQYLESHRNNQISIVNLKHFFKHHPAGVGSVRF